MQIAAPMPTAIPRGRRNRHRPRPSSPRTPGLDHAVAIGWAKSFPRFTNRSRWNRWPRIWRKPCSLPNEMLRSDFAGPGSWLTMRFAVSIRLLREGTHWMAASRLYKRIKKTNYHGGKSDRYMDHRLFLWSSDRIKAFYTNFSFQLDP